MSKREWGLAIGGLLAIALITVLWVTNTGAQNKENKDKGGDDKVIKTESGLEYVELKVGTGDEAKAGKTVTVHYIGTYKDTGKEFDKSIGGDPYTFKLGAGRVIKGWDEGLVRMKVGGKRKLIIPYKLAYGEEGGQGIPGKKDLVFEVELMKVQ